jgi:hypothetical protein
MYALAMATAVGAPTNLGFGEPCLEPEADTGLCPLQACKARPWASSWRRPTSRTPWSQCRQQSAWSSWLWEVQGSPCSGVTSPWLSLPLLLAIVRRKVVEVSASFQMDRMGTVSLTTMGRCGERCHPAGATGADAVAHATRQECGAVGQASLVSCHR